MAHSSYIIPSRFHAARSLLGRWIRLRSVDARQAESTYFVVAVLSFLTLLLVHFLGWSLVQPSGAGTAIVLSEVVLILAYAAFAFAGRDRAITIRTEESSLRISRDGDGELILPYDEIEGACRIDARTFHRHYRRYAQTRAFVNHVHAELLFFRWNGIPVVLGPADDDLSALLQLLGSRVAAGCASSHVDAA